MVDVKCLVLLVILMSVQVVWTRDTDIDIDNNLLWRICRQKFCANTLENVIALNSPSDQLTANPIRFLAFESVISASAGKR